jgi:hypothetical protein
MMTFHGDEHMLPFLLRLHTSFLTIDMDIYIYIEITHTK